MSHAKPKDAPPEVSRTKRARPLLRRVVLPTAVYIAVSGLALLGGGKGFEALFSAWGLTDETLMLAPYTARLIVSAHTGIVYALSALLAWLAARRLAGSLLPKKSPVGGMGYGLVLGLIPGAAVALLSIGLDSLRFEPLAPVLTLGQLGATFVQWAVCACETDLLCGIVFEGVAREKTKAAAYAAAAVAGLLFSTNPFMMPGMALMTLVAVRLYDCRGFGAAWMFASVLRLFGTRLFCWPGQATVYPGVFTLYHVSEAWLTGGENGAFAGVYMLMALILTALLLFPKKTGGDRHGSILARRRRAGAKGAGGES